VSHDSILLSHGGKTRRAFLLLHGLTASPRQFEAFGRILHERGSNVFIPRLPRHGLSDRLTTALAHLTADELLQFSFAAVEAAEPLGEEVIAVGFSVGGLLSAVIGQYRPVARSISIAPFLGVAWLPPRLTARALRFALHAPNQFWWWDPMLRERQQPEHGYPRFATHAVAHAAGLGSRLLRDAARSKPAAADVRIVLNASETTVSNRAARRLAALWASRSPESTVLHRLKGLPPSHDIIEPMRSPEIVRAVYPALIDLVDG
jgi:alpha-beta hydrolase superfamily lysophospholipase